jgi:RNA polymerase sigma-70 factor (ECF subfamily)
LQELVYRYADTLPVKKRQIFLLHVRNKLSTREIAGELQISQKTVQNQLGSALQGLKTNLAPVVLVILSTRL